jgi:hypothetical protein
MSLGCHLRASPEADCLAGRGSSKPCRGFKQLDDLRSSIVEVLPDLARHATNYT